MPNLVFEADAATRRVLGLTSVAAPLNTALGDPMATAEERQSIWRSEFALLGEENARMVDPGAHIAPSDKVIFLRVWLAMLESAKRDAREEATLSIAKEANRIASEALLVATDSAASAFEQARWAKWAAILAAIAALIATKDQIISLVMSWFSN